MIVFMIVGSVFYKGIHSRALQRIGKKRCAVCRL